MKVRSLVSLLVLIGIMINFTGVSAQQRVNNTKDGPKPLRFDKQKFIDTIKGNRLGAASNLDGFAAVIIKDGNLVTEVAGGQAIRSGAGLEKVDMTTSIPADVGSVFKFISFVTLLSLFEKRAAMNPALTIDKQLDESIRPYLPEAWREFVDMPPDDKLEESKATLRISKTTFRQLLSHKSGFRSVNNKSSPFNYIDLGIQQHHIGVREYSNFNAAVLTYLWPRLVNPEKAKEFDKQLDKVAHNNHAVYGKLYGDFFENWMQQNVFNVIEGGSFRPSCDPAIDFPKRNPPVAFARYYSDPLSGAKPVFWSEKANNHGCHAQGGYFISMRQLATYMANFQKNKLVSAKVRSMMYDDSTATTRDARLGWNKTLESAFITKYFDVNMIPTHGGSTTGYSGIVYLPGGYIAVGTMTGPGTSDAVRDLLKNGWAEAVRANFE